MNYINKSDAQKNEIYATPIAKSIILEKHEAFADQILKTFDTVDDPPYCFTKTSLQSQMQYRMIPLVADPFSDQVSTHTARNLRLRGDIAKDHLL